MDNYNVLFFVIDILNAFSKNNSKIKKLYTETAPYL